VTSEGTRIAVDSGKASLRITPNPARHWWIESGPFVVTVRGTVFDVSWEPSVERFELDLHDGHVTVEGPVSGGRLALQKGQRLVVNLAKSETVITEGTFPESATESSDSMARDGAATSRPTPSATMPQAASASPPAIKAPVAAAEVAPTRSWAEHLANGNWDHILSEVNRLGVDAALNQASSADLNALADAARYRHRIDLARDALLAQRRRFPSSSRAIDALFLLGRVEESRSGATTRALGWYDEYLKRAPSGSFAAEALGRKMVILNQTSSAAQARTLAEAYLSRFPEGSYAGAARAILRVR
jgi:TolA-binding protein